MIAKPSGHLDAGYIVELMMQHSVTGFICTVPTLTREYVAELERRGHVPYEPMRSWGIGGESAPADVVHQMQAAFPNLLGPVNMYGPTEATAVTVQHIFSKDFEHVVIGRPDGNTHAYIVDSQLRSVPVGVPGELLLSGPRLALGYANRPDLTAAAFISNPCKELVIERVDPALASYYELAYRTGDLVRWRSDGTIDFLGRIDRQVKITGVRIELGEVEAAIDAVEGVTQSIAAAVKDPEGQKRLVGYVTPDTVDPLAIIAHCRSLLIPAMVPSVVVPLASFPLLPNGKVDVRALPAPEWPGAKTEEYVGPANDAEAAVQQVFAKVLGRPVEELSVLADFFGAGGTSIQVFRATALLQDAMGIASVPATLVHGQRTARGVAAALIALKADGGEGRAGDGPIPVNNWPNAYRPLSSNQEQMWLLSNLAGAIAYNMPKTFELERPCDVETLQAALDAVAARHEVLRTRLRRLDDGTVTGVVEPVGASHVPVAVVTVDSQYEEMREIASEYGKAFDLESDMLIRARLVVRQQPLTGAALVVTTHHAAGDAWSMGVFQREFSMAYEAAVQKSTPTWEPLPIQYSDYAAWQRQQVTRDSGAALRAFWKKTLSGTPGMLQLPIDRPRPSKPTFEGRSVRTELPPGLLHQVDDVAKSLRVNTQAVLLAAFQVVLLQYSGQDDIVVGIPVAGRDRTETHNLMGYFINTLPVRCVAYEDATFAEIIKEASSATLSALDHALLSTEEVVASAGVARVPNANPLFQVLFQYLPEGSVPGAIKLGDIPVKDYAIPVELSQAKIDLTVVLGKTLFIEYMAELFDESTVQRMANAFLAVLDSMVKDSNGPALRGSLLREQDLDEVAKISMGKEHPEYLDAPLMHEAFEASAQRSPNHLCLCYEGEWLTYAEVNTKASTVAQHLAAHQVGPGVVVGVMVERSFDLIVSILAVLKAGGCYLPLDPSYPDDRLAIYLEDSGARTMLVQEGIKDRAVAMVGKMVTILDVETLGKPLQRSVTLQQPGPQDPCYIIFTSGSTGRPKGVMLPHRGVRDLLPWLIELYGVGKQYNLSCGAFFSLFWA